MEPGISQFGSALAWLLSKDISSTRLARIFHTTPSNIRVSAFRARHPVEAGQSDGLALVGEPLPGFSGEAGIRPGPDLVVRTPVRARKLERLRNEIEEIVAAYSGNYQFMEGVRRLRSLLPQIGFANDTRRIALAALLHQYIAWFLVHVGRCDSATREAYDARHLWQIAYHEANERDYAEHFIQSSLIGSQAMLLNRSPQRAWRLLEVASDAATWIGAPEGSDYARQRGVALFQLREDERAIRQFEKAARAMERLNEAKVPAQFVMTGARYISLLGDLKWDAAQEVLSIAKHSFGDGSLEASMALHWATACGLSTDSTSIAHDAVDLLQNTTEPDPQFGHQLTIRKLMTITPELGLDSRLRRMWVRRVLYENAFRRR